MNGVCDELDEVRAELEKLKEECRSKTKLIDSLRTAHNEQKSKLQGAMAQIEELAQELRVKTEEIPELKKLYEELELKVHEKESLLRHLNSANEKLRADYGARFQKLEAENKELAAALDEATERIQDLELKDRSRNEEVEGLKRLISNKQKKFFESDQNAIEDKEGKQKEVVILRLEDENRHVQEQLKWKNEQFAHLEDAHRKLQEQFRSSTVDWKRERSALIEEISSLQSSLDSQTRISETLQTRLKMCNQALAHEESRRKILEVEVSELKSHFETAFSSSHETKTNSDHLTFKRDEEISNLRNLIGTKDINSKEMEHRIAQLEQEKQGLKDSLKESEINNAELTLSLKKLEYKIQDLEQLHENTLINLQKKEDDHSYQIEKLTEVVEGYKSKLKGKNKKLQELQNDLDGYCCLLEAQSEEISTVMMIMKSEYSAAYLKLINETSEKDVRNKESEEKVLLLTTQLEMKDSAFHSLNQKLEKKNEEATSLVERVKSYDCMEQQYIFMEEELQRHKKMLAESSENQNCLKKQVLNVESTLKMHHHESNSALEKANAELARRISEVSNVEAELQKWRSHAENLDLCLRESQETSCAENICLKSAVKKQDEEICSLQQQIASLESRHAEKIDAILKALEAEKEHCIRTAEDDRSTIEKLQLEILSLTQNFSAREMDIVHAQEDAVKALEQEKNSLLLIIRDKNQLVAHLSEQAKLTEQHFTSTFVCLVDKQIEVDFLSESLDKTRNLKKAEIEEKEKIGTALRMEIKNLQEKLVDQEEYLLQMEQKTEQLEALLQTNNSEIIKLNYQSSFEQKHLESLVKELELQKGALLEDITKLSAHRDDLLTQLDRFLEQIDVFSGKDLELVAKLENISHTFEEEKNKELESLADSGLNNSPSKIVKQLHISEDGTGGTIEQRFPLSELNF
ncbi:hypothetical protein DCAR_0624270 [Daucus carota subsp. sativus]|uniref:Uncharacterized protein n=1 Tax=Daucus carota subsp. sativus TaxID=79200 RepID=A0A161XDD7_DAUCS|nr:PREDICTED: uncharacterized protein At4g38062-like [Daucus carota subsp. sativus]WOH04858.1 hypothetical protein DCAR_0624270 [Daucus carota subsp. sativus]